MMEQCHSFVQDSIQNILESQSSNYSQQRYLWPGFSVKGPNFAFLFYCVDTVQLLTILLEEYRTVIICYALHGRALCHRKLKEFVWLEAKPGNTL